MHIYALNRHHLPYYYFRMFCYAWLFFLKKNTTNHRHPESVESLFFFFSKHQGDVIVDQSEAVGYF